MDGWYFVASMFWALTGTLLAFTGALWVREKKKFEASIFISCSVLSFTAATIYFILSLGG